MDGFVVEIALKVGGEGRGGFVAAGAVFLKTLQDDPIEIAAEEFNEVRAGASSLVWGGGRPTVPGASSRSRGVAIVAQAISVDPYRL